MSKWKWRIFREHFFSVGLTTLLSNLLFFICFCCQSKTHFYLIFLLFFFLCFFRKCESGIGRMGKDKNVKEGRKIKKVYKKDHKKVQKVDGCACIKLQCSPFRVLHPFSMRLSRRRGMRMRRLMNFRDSNFSRDWRLKMGFFSIFYFLLNFSFIEQSCLYVSCVL